MKKDSNLFQIAVWEAAKPENATFFRVCFKSHLVTKVIGQFRRHPCIWDGFGNAYHSNTLKRFPSADIKLS